MEPTSIYINAWFGTVQKSCVGKKLFFPCLKKLQTVVCGSHKDLGGKTEGGGLQTIKVCMCLSKSLFNGCGPVHAVVDARFSELGVCP